MKQNVKIIACLIALYAFGALSGVGLSKTASAPRPLGIGWSEKMWLERRFAEDCQRLNLTAEQQQTIRAQYDELAVEMRAVREETARKVQTLFVKKGTEVYQALTPEQRTEFRKLNQERRARWKTQTP
jgi:Spy/CpxP family protein refolding chaperone